MALRMALHKTLYKTSYKSGHQSLNQSLFKRAAMITDILKPLFDRKPFSRALSTANFWVMASLMLPSLWITEAQAAREILVMNEHCTINVLNRTVQVDEDGFFTLDNVPSNMGQIKARATCLQEGKLVTAESEYFSVPTNGRVSVGEFFKADGNSVPVELQITNEKPITLKKEGATERLSVIARYRNGNTRDVTAVVNGVNYTPSNPGVIRVDANGLITALRSGSSLITARKDGVVGIARVNVVTSGDSDNDGIPDDIEMANGMNPRDPVDAFEDVDNDGLSALEEYQQGTDINNADSDGDGIKDGEELITGVDGFITNPMIADTDGDGLTDGQEIEVGSDPTDVNSANYAELLVSIEATPGEAVLFYNTLDGESSVQLKVTGILLDGTEVDLTRTSRKTTYQSSDNLIANFGVEDGRIYAGQDGIATITVDNSGFTTNVQITVSSFAPVNISNLVFESDITLSKLHHDGDFVYIASDFGVHVIDVSDPENPVESRRIEIEAEGGAKDVDVALGQVYVFTADKVLVYDQQLLTLKSEVLLPGLFTDVVVIDGSIVVATDAGFHVYDLTNPLLPNLINSEITDKAVKSVDSDGRLLVAIVDADLLTFSAGNLNVITQLSQFTLPIAGQVQLVGEYAFVAPGDGQSQLYSIVDLTNAVEPTQVVTGPDFTAVDLVHVGDYVLYASARPDTSAIPVINVRQVSAPAYQALIPFSNARSRCLSIDANAAFAFCSEARSLHIVQYRKLQDLSGKAPTVTWQAPDYTSTLSQRRSYRVTADVTDDVEVAIVNFYADHELVFSDTSAPYTFIHKVAADATNLVYRVDALDLASNKSSTGDVLFSVVPTGANEEDWKDIDYDYFDEDFLALNIQMDNSRFIAPHKLETVENFVAKGAQEVTVFVDQFNVGGDLIIEANTTLIVKSEHGVNINGNLILKEGARLTVPAAIENNYVKLELDVAGDVRLLEGAKIDLDGKGFNLRHSGGPEGEFDSTENGSWSCHGGVRTTYYNRDCTYGRYDNPIFAGSAGIDNTASYPAIGGGALNLKANHLNLAAHAQISAEGLRGYYNGSGAGGSVQLQVDSLKGAGIISVKGGGAFQPTAPSGGGGRLAIFLRSDSEFSGEYRIAGADNSGSGTLFKKYISQQWGELTIDGNNSKELRYSTPLPTIGRHAITAVELLQVGMWKLSVDGTPWEVSNESTQKGHAGRHLILDAKIPSSKRYQVISNTTNEIIIKTEDDISHVVGNTLSGLYIFDEIHIVKNGWLDVGDDQLVVLNVEDSEISKGTLSFNYSAAQGLIENAIKHGGNIFSKAGIVLGNVDIELPQNNSVSHTRIRAPYIEVNGDFSLTTLRSESDPLNVTPRKLELSLNDGLRVNGNVKLVDFIVESGRQEVIEGKHLFPMHIEATGDISILGDSHVSADSAGYNHSYYFPDFSVTGSNSHAGLLQTADDPTYGNYWFARFPARGSDAYSFGGGVVFLKAANITNMAKVSANGTSSSRASYAAAGGSIHIEAASFKGEGQVQTNAAINLGYYRSSGGRISVLALDNQFTGEYLARSAANGVASTKSSGAGTVFLKQPVEKYGHLIVSGMGSKKLKSTPIKNIGEHKIIAAYSTIPGEWNLRVAGEPWQGSNDQYDYGLTGLEILLGSRNPSSPRYQIKSNTANTITIASEDDLSGYQNQLLVGIHTFKALTVIGSASVDFGKDVIEVLDLNESEIGAGASLYAGSALLSDTQLATAGGHLVLDSWGLVPDVILDVAEGQVTLNDDMAFNSLILNSGQLTFDNLTAQKVSINNANLTVEKSLSTNDLQLDTAILNMKSISAVSLNAVESTVKADSIKATDINLDKSLLINDDISANNVILLTNESIMSTFAQETVPNKLFTLNVTAGTSIAIDETSKLDVSGKGYLASMGYGFEGIFKSMHTGLIRETTGHFFGNLKRPYVHGGGNSGGGVVHLKTPLLTLDGQVKANASYSTSSYIGAGGSILIEAGVLNGAVSGLISATGYNPRSSQYSTGGRVSIITDTMDGYLGQLNTASNDKAASGTALVTRNSSALSDLLVDNNEVQTFSGSTLMPEVGEHEVISAIRLASDEWELKFSESFWTKENTEDTVDLSGIYLDLDISLTDSSHEYEILRNNENRLYIKTENDLSSFVGKTVRGIHKFGKLIVKGGASVDFGGDELRVINIAESEISTGGSVYANYVQSSLLPLVKEQGKLNFKQSDLAGDWVVDFLPPNGALVIEGDLTLDNFYLNSGNIQVDGKLTIAGLASIQNAGELRISELGANDFTASSTLINIDKLTCNALNVSDVVSFLGKELNCQTADISNTNIQIESFTTTSDTNISNTSKISSYPHQQGGDATRLIMRVGGTLSIDETSLIDQTGFGYSFLSLNRSHDETHLDNRFGVNGGVPSFPRYRLDSYSVDPVGRFERPYYSAPGVGKQNSSGGAVDIVASALILNGKILSNAVRVNNDSGAGGSIFVNAPRIEMGVDAAISAQSVSPASIHSSAGSGGRIALVTSDLTGNTGLLSVAAASNSTAGAGTVFIKDPIELFGSLIVNNAGTMSAKASTPLRHVGKHSIQSIYSSINGWKILVDGSPWSNSELPWSASNLDGLWVTFGEGLESQKYQISSNLNNEIYLETDDDLSVYKGGYIQGVHRLKTLVVKGGANVDLGTDLLEIIDVSNSVISDQASVSSEYKNIEVLKSIVASSGEVNISDEVNVVELMLEGGNFIFEKPLASSASINLTNATLSAPSLYTSNLEIDESNITIDSMVVENLTLNSGAVLTTENLTVGNNLQILTGSSLRPKDSDLLNKKVYTLTVVVGDRITIDESSSMDASAKGYPVNYISPGFQTNQIYSSGHAGICSSSTVGAFGRFDQPLYAGSSGSGGAGGGIISIEANSMLLDGYINADGEIGRTGGAGGSIAVSLSTLEGTGNISASGADTAGQSSSSCPGGGGRIAITLDNDANYTGKILAHSGDNFVMPSSGAGTIFIKNRNYEYGKLIVNNNLVESDEDSTPILGIGKKFVHDIARLSSSRVRIHLGSNYQVAGSGLVENLAGLLFNLSNPEGVIKQYEVLSNQRRSIDVIEREPLFFEPDTFVQGVLKFESLDISDGANVDWQENLFEVVGAVNSALDTDGDYLSDIEEVTLGTSTTVRDTDGDGLLDGIESAIGSDPLVNQEVDLTPYIQSIELYTPLDGGRVDLEIQASNFELSYTMILKVGNEYYSQTISGDLLNKVNVVSSELDVVNIDTKTRFNAQSAGISELIISLYGKEISYLVSVSDITNHVYLNQTAVFNNNRITNTVTLNGSKLRSVGSDLTINGDLIVSLADVGGSSRNNEIKLRNLTINGNLIIDNADLLINIEELAVSGNVSLINGASLTTAFSYLSSKSMYPMNLIVGGALSIDDTSEINANGKGYPDGFWSGPDYSYDTRKGCHGGIRLPNVDCTYGRYTKAKFAGSGGGGDSNGGGFISIAAQSAHIDGKISADSDGDGSYNIKYPGAAGGGIDIDVDRLSGAGQITANANGRGYYSGSGGRISIDATLNEFTGDYEASGTASRDSYITGAGTAYILGANSSVGSLYIINPAGNTYSKLIPKGTPVRTVGRHVIQNVFQVSSGEWRVEVSGSPWKTTDESLDWGIQGLDIDLDSSNATNSLYSIDSNTQNTIVIQTPDDLTSYVGKELLGVHTLNKLIIRGRASVDFGEDRLVILDPMNSEIDEHAELFVGEFDELTKQVFIFEPNDNIKGALVINNDLLSGDVVLTRPSGQKLILNKPVDVRSLHIQSGEIIFNAGLTVESLLTLSGDAKVELAHNINLVDLILEDSSALHVNKVVARDLQLKNNATLTTNEIIVDQLIITDESKLTAIKANLADKKVHSLNIKVTNLVVSKNAAIDAIGKGYPDGFWSGPDFSYDTRKGCYGGVRLSEIDCTYGRYQKAKFAGSGGGDASDGGGFIAIDAQTARIDGKISADSDGDGSYNINYPGAAGGGIDIDVDRLLGAGQITANASGRGYYSGSGGRISIDATINEFTGDYAASGTSSRDSYITGAGTVYIRNENSSIGSLHVINPTGSTYNKPIPKGTPIRTVGRHFIQGIFQVSPNEWRVEVSGSLWKPTDELFDWGLQGIEVDLDASSTTNTLYRINSNTENTLLIQTSDDLAAYIGKELLGVHTLDKLIIRGKASVDFGEDRLVILDPLNSEIDKDAELHVGTLNSEAWNVFAANIHRSGALLAEYIEVSDTNEELIVRALSSGISINDNHIPIASGNKLKVRWTGLLEIPRDGLYTLAVDAQGATRIWLDSNEVLTSTCCGYSASSAINLTAGMKEIVIEYENDQGLLDIDLLWVVPGEIEKPVASNYLSYRAPGINGELKLNGTLVFEEELFSNNNQRIEINQSVLTNNLTVSGGHFVFEDDLVVSQVLNIKGDSTVVVKGNFSADQVTLSSNSKLIVHTVDATQVVLNEVATLETMSVVATHLILNDDSILTGKSASIENKKIYPLNIEADTISVAAGASLSMDSKGYPSNNWSGPKFEKTETGGCHAGLLFETQPGCTYGSYEQARFAGSSGVSNGNAQGNGGGLINIEGRAVTINGTVSANGEKGGYHNGGAKSSSGAGGGIHISASELTGSGSIEVNGASYSSAYVSSSGGRISVHALENSFLGVYSAKGAMGKNQISGAGTIYLKTGDADKGVLIVENIPVENGKPLGITPLRQVGNHEVIGIYAESVDEWRIQVANTHWKPSEFNPGYGLQGLTVNLPESGLVGINIISNTEDTLLVRSTDNLNSIVGQRIYGVQNLRKIIIKGATKVDFGGDHLILEDVEGSIVEQKSKLITGNSIGL